MLSSQVLVGGSLCPSIPHHHTERSGWHWIGWRWCAWHKWRILEAMGGSGTDLWPKRCLGVDLRVLLQKWLGRPTSQRVMWYKNGPSVAVRKIRGGQQHLGQKVLTSSTKLEAHINACHCPVRKWTVGRDCECCLGKQVELSVAMHGPSLAI